MPQPPEAITALRNRSATCDNAGNSPGVLEEVLLLGRELRATAHSHVRLAALETRQAGESLVFIIAAGLVAGGLLLSAWLALAGAATMALVERGLMTTSTALLLAMLANAIIAVILIITIRRKSHRLLLSATVNSLAPPGAFEAGTSA